MIQEVLHERVKMYKMWKDEEVALNKKREMKVKFELAHKPDKVSAVTHEITEVSCSLSAINLTHVYVWKTTLCARFLVSSYCCFQSYNKHASVHSATVILKLIFLCFCLDFQLEHRVEKAQEEFEGISKNIRKEVERFELQRYHDFKTAIISYLESVLNNQQQVCGPDLT